MRLILLFLLPVILLSCEVVPTEAELQQERVNQPILENTDFFTVSEINRGRVLCGYLRTKHAADLNRINEVFDFDMTHKETGCSVNGEDGVASVRLNYSSGVYKFVLDGSADANRLVFFANNYVTYPTVSNSEDLYRMFEFCERLNLSSTNIDRVITTSNFRYAYYVKNCSDDGGSYTCLDIDSGFNQSGNYKVSLFYGLKFDVNAGRDPGEVLKYYKINYCNPTEKKNYHIIGTLRN
ncbi:MAG: hypothetical protein JNM93_05655 [Bacteriovoracaceae bacterium]|nr:hypothetical protein [Bacteriovoracaceae bacterium]